MNCELPVLGARPWERIYLDEDDENNTTCIKWTPFEHPDINYSNITLVISSEHISLDLDYCSEHVELDYYECETSTYSGTFCYNGPKARINEAFFPIFPYSNLHVRIDLHKPIALLWGNKNCIAISTIAGSVKVSNRYRKNVLFKKKVKQFSTICPNHNFNLANTLISFIAAHSHYKTIVTDLRCDVRGGLQLHDVKYKFSSESRSLQLTLIPDEKIYTVVENIDWTIHEGSRPFIEERELHKIDDLRFAFACGYSFPFLDDTRHLSVNLPQDCSVIRFYSLCGGLPLFSHKILKIEQKKKKNRNLVAQSTSDSTSLFYNIFYLLFVLPLLWR